MEHLTNPPPHTHTTTITHNTVSPALSLRAPVLPQTSYHLPVWKVWWSSRV